MAHTPRQKLSSGESAEKEILKALLERTKQGVLEWYTSGTDEYSAMSKDNSTRYLIRLYRQSGSGLIYIYQIAPGAAAPAKKALAMVGIPAPEYAVQGSFGQDKRKRFDSLLDEIDAQILRRAQKTL